MHLFHFSLRVHINDEHVYAGEINECEKFVISYSFCSNLFLQLIIVINLQPAKILKYIKTIIFAPIGKVSLFKN